MEVESDYSKGGGRDRAHCFFCDEGLPVIFTTCDGCGVAYCPEHGDSLDGDDWCADCWYDFTILFQTGENQ